MQETRVWCLGREWLPTPVFSSGEFHGQRSHGHKDSGIQLIGLQSQTWLSDCVFILYIYIYICVCIYIYIYIYIYHIFFICSYINGHLGCFLILAVVNNDAVDMGVGCRYLQVSAFIFFGKIPRSGIARSHGSYILIFWGTSILLSIVVAPVYIPTKGAWGFPFLHMLASSYFLSFW